MLNLLALPFIKFLKEVMEMQEIIEAPIPGKVLAVNVTAGNTVEEGAVICTIEAMKMENPIMSPVKGSVKEILVSPGAIVKTGDKLAVIEYQKEVEL
jgi:biotin carboxyl carrier protein